MTPVPTSSSRQLAGLNLKKIKIIFPVRGSPGYNPIFNIVVPPSKEAALPPTNLTNSTVPVHVYNDRSGYEGGIVASALLYINDCLARSIRVYLGTAQEHTVYEAKGVSLLMGLHLLNGLSRRLTHPTVMGTDSQAVIKALKNQSSHPGQYLLDAIHRAAEGLHTKQDGLIDNDAHQLALVDGIWWKGKTRGIVDLQLHWVPGHCNFGPNERADEEAKLAAQGSVSDARFLPQLLCKKLPLSLSMLCQENNEKLKKEVALMLEKLAKIHRQFCPFQKILTTYLWSRPPPGISNISAMFGAHRAQPPPLLHSKGGISRLPTVSRHHSGNS